MRQTLKEIEVNYVANTACDRHNFVLGFVLGAGNIHDSQMLSGVYQNRKSPFFVNKLRGTLSRLHDSSVR